MATEIRKRNGTLVPFEPVKIRNAIEKANKAVGDELMDAGELDRLTAKIVARFDGDVIPSVEEVQDTVEETLIGADYAKTAKAYILYRAEHAKIRRPRDTYGHLQTAHLQDAKDVI